MIVDLSWFFNCSTFFCFFCVFFNDGSTAISDQEKLKCFSKIPEDLNPRDTFAEKLLLHCTDNESQV